ESWKRWFFLCKAHRAQQLVGFSWIQGLSLKECCWFIFLTALSEETELPLAVLSEVACFSVPRCNSAGPSSKQELPAELQCEDKETYETYYQKRGESTAGVFVPSSTNFDLQCEGKDLEHCSSERSKKPQRRLREDNENTVLADVFGEDPEPVSEEALPYRCKKCGSSFQGMSELQEHKRTHLVENSYRCPVCAKEFFRAANLRMHKLIHSSDRPHKCPECDKGFIRTADVWRHLRNKLN
uniref:C2H2-type domain-containing protein n=1 Tax=Calidris pygmaea TaxID=425635 RepID=A0A8C3JW41_9CHAR